MALQGFDKDYYLNAKLEQLQNDPATSATWAGKTADFLESKLLNGFGLTAEQHYAQYGYQEGLAPNAYFDPQEYIQAKAVAMVNDPASSYTSVDAAAKAFVDLWGGNVYQHYLQYGASEGINPSNDFDASAYLEEKLAALQAAGETQYQTADDVKAALAAAGLTPLDHFLEYGQQEGLSAPAVPADEQVTVDNSVAGQTFTLTASADDFTGTDGNDSFVAPAVADSAGGGKLVDTLQSVDILDGGAGDDSLGITFANATSAPAPTLSGIENVNVRFTAGATLDLSNASGVETVALNKSTAAGTVSAIAAGTEVALKNSTNDATLKFANSAVSGTSDTVDLAVANYGSSAKSGLVNITNVSDTANVVEGLNIDATGSNVLDVTGAGVAVASLDVSGSGSLNVTADLAALATVDASSNTGGVVMDLGASSNDLTITGGAGADDFVTGSGDDTVSLGAGDDTVDFKGNLDANDEVDGGDGTDTLSITGNLASGVALTNLETLKMTTNGSNTADMDSGDFDTYKFVSATSADTVVVSNYLDENLVVDSSAALAGLTVNQKDDTSSDVANVTVANSTNDGTKGGETKTTLSSLNAVSAETINLSLTTENANFDGSDEVAVAAIATTAADLVIDGNASATLGGTTDLTNTSIDASAATGDLTVNMGAADQTITTGSGDDVFNFGANGDANDTVDGGAGDDSVSQSVASGTTTVSVNTSNVETVNVTATATDGATSTYNAANVGTDALINLTGTNVDTNTNTASGDTSTVAVTNLDGQAIQISGDVTGTSDSGIVSLALADASGASDSQTISLDGGNNGDSTKDAQTQTVDAISTSDIESVNVAIDSGIDTTTVTIGSMDVTGAENITLSGTDTTTKVEVSAFANDNSVSSIDASTVTGDLTLGELGTGGITLSIDSGDISDAIVAGGNEDTKDITLDSTGAAQDTIVFGDSIGDVTIANFTANNSVVGDVLDLSTFGIASSDDLVFTNNGGNTEITTSADDAFDMITLTGVTPDQVTDANFIYA